jgi:hypothetical protein
MAATLLVTPLVQVPDEPSEVSSRAPSTVGPALSIAPKLNDEGVVNTSRARLPE